MTSFDLAAAYLWRQKLLASMTAAAIALGAAMILLVVGLGAELRRGLLKPSHGVDLVVGASGSETSLVFASLFHVDSPRGNVSLRTYEQIAGVPGVRLCVPFCLGDEYRGCRVVGTTQAFFDPLGAGGGRPCTWSKGRSFAADFEIVVGVDAARRLRLQIGDDIETTHGAGAAHKEHSFKVVGILDPTGTPHDRAMFCNLSSYWRLHESKPAALVGTSIDATMPEVTALLLQCDAPMVFGLQRMLPQKFGVMAVRPVDVLHRAFSMVLAPVERILVLHGYAVALTAAAMLALALFLTGQMNVRDMGILRCLGASRPCLFAFVVWQAVILLVVGSAIGVALSRLALWWLRSDLLTRFGIDVRWWNAAPLELAALASALAMGVAAACFPAWRASRRPIVDLLDG